MLSIYHLLTHYDLLRHFAGEISHIRSFVRSFVRSTEVIISRFRCKWQREKILVEKEFPMSFKNFDLLNNVNQFGALLKQKIIISALKKQTK